MVAERVVRDAGQRAPLHAALADPYRLAIVDELMLSDRSPSELAEMLGLRSNLVAHHLQVLDDVGLVQRLSSHGDKRRRYLRLRRATLARLTQSFVLSVGKILFVCTANSARSQLAAGAWNKRHEVPAVSGGTRPALRVHPGAVRAGKRVGIDLKDARPRPLEALDSEGAVLVVTVCDQAHEELAESGHAPFVHWSIPDPAASGARRAFERAAEEITRRVEELAPLVTPVA